ncbi:MAG TPA: monovalent cation/H(+) antiporter subunit G [Longimicrobiales bacterium]|nr:monovalent cation/H(+) antiporter subunit G [Longimicrobiales bacterium]
MSPWITTALVVIGTTFIVLAALGVLRMPDVYTRMHAATKMPTLAMGCMLLAVAVHFGQVSVAARAVLGIAFFLLTAPVSAHMIGRAAHRAGTPMWRGTVMDELSADRSGSAHWAVDRAGPDPEARAGDADAPGEME